MSAQAQPPEQHPLERELRDELLRFVRECPENRFPAGGGRYFDDPVVGVAAAGDPLFQAYKSIIGPFHRTPEELLPGAASVLCWVLPITRETRLHNRREHVLPARAWAQTRSLGEGFNSSLRRHLAAWLTARGHPSVAPLLTPGWRRLDETPVGIASTWSERHAAYAAGLGTFSLNDGLITTRGIAHRLGSVVTGLRLEPTSAERPGLRDWCAFYGDGRCTACIDRCPAGAISPAGHDKEACRAYVDRAIVAAVAEPWGTPIPGCGLCQTKVPCEERIPPQPKRGRG